MMVFDGKRVCMQEWGADGEPPLGFTKRVYHTLFLWAPAVKQQDLQKIALAVGKFANYAGVQATFAGLGSAKRDRETFAKEIFPDMPAQNGNATHGLTVVAEDPASLKALLAGDAYKKDFLLLRLLLLLQLS